MTVPLGRVVGIPVGASPTVALVVVVAVVLGLAGHLPSPGVLLAGALVVAGSLLVHELGHAVVARFHGFDVDGIVVTVFGGTTRYTGSPDDPWARVGIAAAGPCASAALALGFALAAGHHGVLAFGAWLNLWQTFGNLVPVPTSDGAALLRGVRDAIRSRRD